MSNSTAACLEPSDPRPSRELRLVSERSAQPRQTRGCPAVHRPRRRQAPVRTGGPTLVRQLDGAVACTVIIIAHPHQHRLGEHCQLAPGSSLDISSPAQEGTAQTRVPTRLHHRGDAVVITGGDGPVTTSVNGADIAGDTTVATRSGLATSTSRCLPPTMWSLPTTGPCRT